MRQRYQLGVMDLYPVVANRSKIENNPFLQVVLKEDVDPIRLHAAMERAIEEHPLFGCTLGYEGGYFLETNDRPFSLICASEQDRPLAFGDATNGFLWQLCYHGKEIIFEWCHAISDGTGGFNFFSSVLCHYFGVPAPHVPLSLSLGLESLYDKKEKGIPQKKQPRGFAARDLPYLRRGYKTDCHILRAPMKEVLAAAKRTDSSPAAVLPPLFSMALRKHLRPSAKNKNVRCNVVIDCRGPAQTETMHNCIISKNITYIDRFEGMEFPLVSTIYRAILDLAVQRENVIAKATKTVDTFRPIVRFRPRFLQKPLVRLVAAVLKHGDSNFTFTYLGRLRFPEAVLEQMQDIRVRSWTDFGECNIAAVDFDGTLILNICENYSDKEIVPDFIELCSKVGIHFEYAESLPYEQANLRMKNL